MFYLNDNKRAELTNEIFDEADIFKLTTMQFMMICYMLYKVLYYVNMDMKVTKF